MALGPPRGGGGSDGCARGSDTSGRPSQSTLPRPCITAGMQGPNVVHEAPRGQKMASSGSRPEPLVEVSEPQMGAVTVGHVAAPGPLLVVVSLAGGDAVDATTVSFHLRENLCGKKKEEEEKERKERREVAEHEGRMRAAEYLSMLSSSSSQRRRKKRKKKKPP